MRKVSFESAIGEAISCFDAGDLPVYYQILDRVGRFIGDLAERGDIDAAIAAEGVWYNALVKKIENEGHYRRCFSNHHWRLWNAGVRARVGNFYLPVQNRIAFLAPTGALLGHTEVMLRLLSDLRETIPGIFPSFISLSSMSEDLAVRLNALNISWYAPKTGLSATQSLKWVRDILKQICPSRVVWLSVPCSVPFLFGSVLAPHQVYWSLKFKAYELPEEIVHIGYPHRESGAAPDYIARWTSYMPPFGIRAVETSEKELLTLKNRFRNEIVFGTLAREEILNQQDYINAVIRIMQQNPEAVFLYTGRAEPVALARALESSGLKSRSHYVGWVDTSIFSRLITVFLEPFPFGCGVTLAQALGVGTRVVSLWGPRSFPSVYFSSIIEAARFERTWKVASGFEEYVRLAVKSAEEAKALPRVPVDLRMLDAGRATEFLAKIGMPR
jgi:hypothetical protein